MRGSNTVDEFVPIEMLSITDRLRITARKKSNKPMF